MKLFVTVAGWMVIAISHPHCACRGPMFNRGVSVGVSYGANVGLGNAYSVGGEAPASPLLPP